MKEKIKKIIKHSIYYIGIILALLTGYFLGRYYNDLTEVIKKPKTIQKANVKIATDETNDLYIIDQTDGSYVSYEDSVGYAIWNVYSRTVFARHTNTE